MRRYFHDQRGLHTVVVELAVNIREVVVKRCVQAEPGGLSGQALDGRDVVVFLCLTKRAPLQADCGTDAQR